MTVSPVLDRDDEDLGIPGLAGRVDLRLAAGQDDSGPEDPRQSPALDAGPEGVAQTGLEGRGSNPSSRLAFACDAQ